MIHDFAKAVATPWEMAVGADRAMPGVAGRPTAKARMANAYIARLHAAARHDPVLAAEFLRLSGLLKPPPALLHPAVATRVARSLLRGGM